jgi:hypothetical protein
VINFQFFKPHGTIISKSDALSIQPIEVSSPDGKGSFYRCPLCPLSNAYYNIQANKVIDHINGNKHFGIAVRHRSWIICRCDDVQCMEHEILTQSADQQPQTPSKPKAHRHCPHCGRLYSRRNEFLFHIERCCTSALSSATTTAMSPVQKNQPKKQQTKQGIIQTNGQLCNSTTNGSSNYVYLISTQTSSQSAENMSKRKLINDIDLMDDSTSPKPQKCLVTSSMYEIDEVNAEKVISYYFLRRNKN